MPLRVGKSKEDKGLFYITEQLKSTSRLLKEYAKDDPDWEVDIDAINYAIKELERNE